MKKILFLISFALTAVTFAQEAKINWMTLDQALQMQQKDPKPIFMDIYTEWCGPCKMLDKNTFSDPAVIAEINSKYYAVKFNGEGNEVVNYKGETFSNPGYDPNKKTSRNSMHEFTKKMEVKGYPSMYILDENGNEQKLILGYYKPEELLNELKS